MGMEVDVPPDRAAHQHRDLALRDRVNEALPQRDGLRRIRRPSVGNGERRNLPLVHVEPVPERRPPCVADVTVERRHYEPRRGVVGDLEQLFAPGRRRSLRDRADEIPRRELERELNAILGAVVPNDALLLDHRLHHLPDFRRGGPNPLRCEAFVNGDAGPEGRGRSAVAEAFLPLLGMPAAQAGGEDRGRFALPQRGGQDRRALRVLRVFHRGTRVEHRVGADVVVAQVDRGAARLEDLSQRPLLLAERDGEGDDHRDDAAVRVGERERGLAEERVEVARVRRPVALESREQDDLVGAHGFAQRLVGRIADDDVESAPRVLVEEEARVGFRGVGVGVEERRPLRELDQLLRNEGPVLPEEAAEPLARLAVRLQDDLLLLLRVRVDPRCAGVRDRSQRVHQPGVGEAPRAAGSPIGVGDGSERVGADDARLEVGQRRVAVGFPVRRLERDEEAQARDLRRERVNVLPVQLALDDLRRGLRRGRLQLLQRGLERREASEQERPGAGGGIEDANRADARREAPPVGVAPCGRNRRAPVAEQFEYLRVRRAARRLRPRGGGERVLHHLNRDVGGRVVRAARLPVERLVALDGQNEALEQVAQQFRVERLVALPRAVLVRRPVVAREDGEESRVVLVRAPVRGGGQVQAVVAVLLHKDRPVQERRVLHHRVNRRVRVRVPFRLGNVQALMEEEAQRLRVVAIRVGQRGVRESALEEFGGNEAVLLEDPREHHADEMPQHGLAMRLLPPRRQAFRPRRHLRVEPLPQQGDVQRREQAVGVRLRRGERGENLLEGEFRRRRGHAGIERRGHCDAASGAGRKPRLSRAVLHLLIGEKDARSRVRGAGERPGAERRVAAAQPPGVRREPRRRDRDLPLAERRERRLPGGGRRQRRPHRVGVVAPVAVVRVQNDALQRNARRQIRGNFRHPAAEQMRQNSVRLRRALRERRQQTLRPVEPRPPSARNAAHPLNDAFAAEVVRELPECAPRLRVRVRPIRIRRIQERRRRVGGCDGREVVLAQIANVQRRRVFRPLVEAPAEAVGENADAARPARGVLPHIALDLPVGRLGAYPAGRLVEIRAGFLRLDDQRSVAGLFQEFRRVADFVGLVAILLQLGTAVGGRIAQRRERGLDQQLPGVFLARIAPLADMPQPVAQSLGDGLVDRRVSGHSRARACAAPSGGGMRRGSP